MAMRWRSIAAVLGCVWMGFGPSVTAAPPDGAFDVADISYLWPLPATQADVDALIPSDAPTTDGGAMLPRAAFDSVLKAIDTTVVIDRAGGENRIVFDVSFATALKQPSTWKVAGFRVDPAAVGHAETLASFGVMPQLRLIVQPVTVGADGKAQVHDLAAHLVYGYFTGAGPPFAPDRAKFQALVGDLAALKAASPAPTGGTLGVHPGLRAHDAAFDRKVKAFIARHTAPSRARLFAISFTGTDPPEPWIFFALVGKPDGTFVPAPQGPLGGGHAQAITFRGSPEVAPVSAGINTGQAGKSISTAPLFDNAVIAGLEKPAVAGLPRPLRREVADFIANPQHAHVFNTDCVSCHTESTRRRLLQLADGDGRFRFEPPAGASGVDPAVLPTTKWNVRNFGWSGRSATISQRAANEAAESLGIIAREYATGPPSAPQARLLQVSFTPPRQNPPRFAAAAPRKENPAMVATPLTLVMDIKSPEDLQALKTLLGKLQAAPPDQNPIRVALNKLRIVHYARFVFLNDSQLAIITTFDGSFDDYIDAFVNTIGDVFNQLLSHMKDAPPLPVQANRDAFLAYVKAHDRASIQPFYSAYPDLSVRDILTLQRERAQTKTAAQP